MNKNPVFTRNEDAATMTVAVSFDAPVAAVWSAWTESDKLDQWWAPQPWRAETKAMDFREGGYWLYAMRGPDGETHWSRADYRAIDMHRSIDATDGFCDENGAMNRELPVTQWMLRFSPEGNATHVTIDLRFATKADMETLIQMGFQEGFTAGLNNLHRLLAAS